jgi:hypothetical protein
MGGGLRQPDEQQAMGRLMGDQLWVPLDAEERTVVIALNGLDDSVRRPRHRTQARTHVCHRLVMHAVHAERPLAGDRSQEASGLDFDGMNRLAVSLIFSVGLVSTGRQVLDESTSGRHVQHLGSAAYP